jgi:hypothetical protein
MFASIVVGALVICACGLSTASVRNEAETQQLISTAEHVATESLGLISDSPTAVDNATSTIILNVPSSIGNKIYWIQLANDSSRAWVEVGFGTVPQTSEKRVFIPSALHASGTFRSGYGAAILGCVTNTSGVYLTLSGGS